MLEMENGKTMHIIILHVFFYKKPRGKKIKMQTIYPCSACSPSHKKSDKGCPHVLFLGVILKVFIVLQTPCILGGVDCPGSIGQNVLQVLDPKD